MRGSDAAARGVTIVGWDPARAKDFDRLNRWWLEKWFTIEPLDEEYLGDPQGRIVDPGGWIWFALDESGCAVGTVGAAVHDGAIELVKLGVDPAHHGHGTGRLLCEAVIAFARERGFDTLTLVSNSGLTAAIRLYERLGFVHRPFPYPPPFIEADVYMELPLR